MLRRMFIALALLSLGAGMARAQIVYDNGPPDLVDGWDITQWTRAQDFTLGGAATISGMRFWNVEYDPSSYLGSISWWIYDGSGGMPGAVLFSGVATPTRVATGNNILGYPEYLNDFAVSPFTLTAGTYWLGLLNGSGDGLLGFFWETAAPNGTSTGMAQVVGDSFWDVYTDLQLPENAFVLLGPSTTVPEPSTILLMLPGLAGVVAAARRKRIR